MFDADRIQRDREICEAATKGPWEEGYSNGITGPTAACFIGIDEMKYMGMVCKPNEVSVGGKKYCAGVICMTAVGRDDDAAFIATARTELPAALDEIVRLQDELAESQKRERAAVADMESLMLKTTDMSACMFCSSDKSWGCAIRRTPPSCTPKWRGPQD